MQKINYAATHKHNTTKQLTEHQTEQEKPIKRAPREDIDEEKLAELKEKITNKTEAWTKEE